MTAALYGSDLSTFNAARGTVQLEPSGTLITGPRVVLEACARRLLTAKGSLPGAPDYGLDLLTYAGKRITPVARERIKADVEAELARDERVNGARVIEFAETAPGAFRMRVRVTLATGEFSFTLSAGPELTVELLDEDRG